MQDVTTTGMESIAGESLVVPIAKKDGIGSPRRTHWIGIGGAGMRSLASVLADARWEIRGSDACEEACRELAQDRGWKIVPGHRPANLAPDTDLVVYSQAIAADNPERVEAHRRGLPSLSYAAMLGRVFQSHPTRLAVAGSHGKSTVVAMVASILAVGNRHPSVVFGATTVDPLRESNRSPRPVEIALVEACEYRDNFSHLFPTAAVVTSVEPDHFDCYPSMDSLTAAFHRFVRRIDPAGYLLVAEPCGVARQVARSASCRVESFGLTASADWTARPPVLTDGVPQFEIEHRGRPVARVTLRVPGEHNRFNALAAVALATRAGATPAEIEVGLERFAGLRRRLEWVGTLGGVAIWDDYAHHPTAITATLKTLRSLYPRARIRCVFQPHQASRTKRLFDAFAMSLQGADQVVICDIVRAREAPWQKGDVTAEDLAQRVREMGLSDCRWHPTAENGTMIALASKLVCYPGDVVVTLGAGNIWKVAHALTNRV